MFGFAKTFGVAKGVKAEAFALTPAWALPKREKVDLMETCVRCNEDFYQEDCRYFEASEYSLSRGWVSGWYCYRHG